MTIILRNIDFEWPNGHLVFKDLSISLEDGSKYGLIGPNGAGKSTLAKLIQGGLSPTRGTIRRGNSGISCFPQFEAAPGIPVEEYLEGLWMNVRPAETKVIEALRGEIDFCAPCARLSGGEWTRVRLLRQLASGADLIVLDEPTNNLDREAKQGILDFARLTPRGLLVISHDRELLELVHAVLELSNRGLSVYGGNWSFYEEERERERERLLERLERSKRERDKAGRDRVEKLQLQEKRMRHAENFAPKSGLPKIVIGKRKRQAQRTLAKLDQSTARELETRVSETQEAFEAVKRDPVIYAEFPETAIPASKLVVEARGLNFRYEGMAENLWSHELSFALKGPARLSISGTNGSGKTTLLNLLTGFRTLDGNITGELKLGGVAFGLVDQFSSVLDEQRSVFENAYASSRKGVIEIRNLLAQFLFPGSRADQVVSTLSGGERLRASLAKLLISDPVPQLLILDEPTNNLDLPNLEFLEQALLKFQGAMIVISHDRKFLEKIGITGELRLS